GPRRPNSHRPAPGRPHQAGAGGRPTGRRGARGRTHPRPHRHRSRGRDPSGPASLPDPVPPPHPGRPLMKLLLIGVDGVRLDVALPAALSLHPGFAAPDHPADPRFRAEEPDGAQRPAMPAREEPTAPTLARLLEGGTILPVWMTPPTDSGPGWASLLTGTTHEQNNVWWNEFVGHRPARTPDIRSRVCLADPRARP